MSYRIYSDELAPNGSQMDYPGALGDVILSPKWTTESELIVFD
jgi:hypothetical protein